MTMTWNSVGNSKLKSFFIYDALLFHYNHNQMVKYKHAKAKE